jgi:hypothetical protein
MLQDTPIRGSGIPDGIIFVIAPFPLKHTNSIDTFLNSLPLGYISGFWHVVAALLWSTRKPGKQQYCHLAAAFLVFGFAR